MADRPPLPSLLEAFDLEAELAAAKARIPVLSGGLWTDTSDSDPGVVAVRVMLEAIERQLYSLSARYAPDAFVTQLGKLLGVSALEAAKAGGMVAFTVAPGTTVQAGFQVADPIGGQVYEVVTGATSALGGRVDLEVRAVNPGTAANVRVTGRFLELRSSPAAGQVFTATNVTPLDGGSDGETLEAFRARLPGLIQNDTLNYPAQFEAEARNVAGVARARAYRGTRPIGAGLFLREPGHTLVVVVGAGGAAPGPSTLAAVRAALLAKSWFNQKDVHPDYPYLHVQGVRSRAVDVSGVLYARPGANPATLEAAAEARITAYLDPLTGGQDGAGYAIGQTVQKSELYWALQDLRSQGLAYVDDSSFSVVGAANLALDELIGPGTIDFTVRVLP